MQRRLEGVGWDEVVVLQEVAAKLRRKKHNGCEHHQEDADREDVVHRVVRVEWDAIQGVALRIFGCTGRLDFNAVWIVGTHFVQSNDVRHHQAQQNQGHCNDVETEEAVQGGIAHHEIAANEQRQVGADEGDGREQIHNDLCAPVGHLAPRQQVTHEGFGHEA